MKSKFPLGFTLCAKSILDTLTPKSSSYLFFVHTPINPPYKSQTLSYIPTFWDAGPHLNIVASYVEFSLFSKITSPSLFHLFPVSYLLSSNKPDRNGGSVWIDLLSQFSPQSSAKDHTWFDLTVMQIHLCYKICLICKKEALWYVLLYLEQYSQYVSMNIYAC